jgi:C-terminal processing protease CtpA/Prc
VSANAATPASAVLGVAQILRILGIEARYGASGWKVTSVATDTMSDRAGVKMGDVIEAIDDRKLGEKTTFDRTISIKQLNVLRGGTRVKIVIGGR